MKGIQLADYDLSVEVVRDDTGKIVSGMVIGDVLEQNQAIILNLHKGELKENPYLGVGLSDMLLDYNPLAWRTEIREQLEMDGQVVDSVKVSPSGIEIDAHY